jgi:hypothetical protein
LAVTTVAKRASMSRANIIDAITATPRVLVLIIISLFLSFD